MISNSFKGCILSYLHLGEIYVYLVGFCRSIRKFSYSEVLTQYRLHWIWISQSSAMVTSYSHVHRKRMLLVTLRPTLRAVSNGARLTFWGEFLNKKKKKNRALWPMKRENKCGKAQIRKCQKKFGWYLFHL